MTDIIQAIQTHKRVPFVSDQVSRTKQAPKDEVNVNIIVENFRRTGALPARAQTAAGVYGDYTGFDDFHSQVNRMMDAQDAFDRLPAKVRRTLNDNPQELIRAFYSTDPADQQLMVDLELRDKPEITSVPEENPLTAPEPPETPPVTEPVTG